MTTDTFRCPNCRRSLRKSAAATILGASDRFVVSGDSVPEITCPACGGSIDAEAMIRGDYDVKEESLLVTLLGFAFAIFLIYLFLRYVAEWLLAAVLVGSVVVTGIGIVWAVVKKIRGA